MNSESASANIADNQSAESLVKKVHLKRKSDFVNKNAKRTCCKEVRRGLDDSTLKETEYYFENYLRKVYPYYFTYTTFCKGRWVGKNLIDVFSEEFRAHSKEEYEKNIAVGNIKINGKPITGDYVFKDNDRVTNKVHRHEIAVAAAPIKVIHSSDEFLIVDKPPSIPIHPCGRYRHNCLLFILAKDHGFKELYSVHRLDRLTSGLLVFTKTIKKSQEINEQIRERKVKKEYVCRVVGNFPDGIIHCKESLEVISPKMGICIVSPTGKECETIFEKLSYNGTSSVVSCKPLTGRMHQIRVHLQYLGHPITNDPIYNHDHVFGPLKGKNGDMGKSREQLLEDLLKTHNLQKWLIEDGPLLEESNTSIQNSVEEDKKNKMSLNALEYYLKSDGYEKLAEKYVKKPENFIIEDSCDLCHQRYMDPQPKDLIMFLHALKYRGEGWEFESELPSWAKDDWKETITQEL
ncbi:RNA pseudouridylate synthase domain-containing protein 2 [Trichonephila clavata]|uniref:Pseudouridine synthase n=1 Tax=Trichonephila clavata TaxID=2740835 RepID=A0A8X6G3W2_TRICU|nr:RNA pseudouridylate synthase domain-containing protein 2 [Trichonephila clavata]